MFTFTSAKVGTARAGLHGIPKPRSLSRAAGCQSSTRRSRFLVEVFGATILGVIVHEASAHHSPPTCTQNGSNGSGTAIGFVTAPGITMIHHGDEVCFQVQISNNCTDCCDVTLLDTELVLPHALIVPIPDESKVPITKDATLNFGDSILCPGDLKCVPFCDEFGAPLHPDCVPSSFRCTIPGEIGYKYIVDHGDEHGETGVLCPPTPAPGFGEVSAFLRSTGGTVHQSVHVGASLCQPIAVDICDGAHPGGPTLPKPDDRTFVTTANAVLHSGMNPFDIPVTRYAGPTNTETHSLLHAVELLNDDLIDKYAVLTIAAFGVSSGAQHAVSFNGTSVDVLSPTSNPSPYLKAAEGAWSITTFKIPLNAVKFPDGRGSGGNAPAAQPNSVTIDVAGAPACLRVKGMSLSIKVMSPIILIHGNESDGGFFVRQGFVDGLDEKNLLWDNSILLPAALREDSAKDLRAFVPGIVKSFGVDSVHLVAHSKGGLDAREYLQKHQPNQVPPFTVLSLTTLSTPHNGSILADISVAQSKAVDRAAKIEYPGLPAWALIVGEYLTPSLGWPSLTTQECAHFNASNVDRLPEGVIYNSVASDADKNYDLEIDGSESWRLYLEDGWLIVMDGLTLTDNVLTALYKIQRSTSSVKLRYENREGPWGSRMLVAVIEGREVGTQYGSDPMVTTRSGLGTNGWSRRTRNNALLTGSGVTGQGGRNHATVADGGVAALVREWLITTERENGDLK